MHNFHRKFWQTSDRLEEVGCKNEGHQGRKAFSDLLLFGGNALCFDGFTAGYWITKQNGGESSPAKAKNFIDQKKVIRGHS